MKECGPSPIMPPWGMNNVTVVYQANLSRDPEPVLGRVSGGEEGVGHGQPLDPGKDLEYGRWRAGLLRTGRVLLRRRRPAVLHPTCGVVSRRETVTFTVATTGELAHDLGFGDAILHALYRQEMASGGMKLGNMPVWEATEIVLDIS